MSLLDSLKSIFKIDINLSKLERVNILSGNKNGQAISINSNNKVININIDSIKSEDIPKLQEAIKKAVQIDDDLLIEDNANKLLEDIATFEASGNDKDIYEFFKGKISSTDLEILRASLYIKHAYDEGKHVGDLKRDLTLKFGERGRNISNLCSAGYFSSILIPLYHEMIKLPNFTPNMYTDAFSTIVSQSAFAIFVSSQTTPEQLIQEVEEKITVRKRYGINYLNIHGIGENNVGKIEQVLITFKDRFTHTPDIESGRGFITVTLYF